MFDKIILFFKSQDWQYHIVGGESTAIFTINGKNGSFRCLADVQEDNKVFIFYSICNFNCPQEQLQVIAELITKLNYNRIFGNFELDYSDGEVRYKTSAYYSTSILEDEVIENVIMNNVVSMDTALKGLLTAMLSKVEVDRIVAEIEKILLPSETE